MWVASRFRILLVFASIHSYVCHRQTYKHTHTRACARVQTDFYKYIYDTYILFVTANTHTYWNMPYKAYTTRIHTISYTVLETEAFTALLVLVLLLLLLLHRYLLLLLLNFVRSFASYFLRFFSILRNGIKTMERESNVPRKWPIKCLFQSPICASAIVTVCVNPPPPPLSHS